MNSPSSPPRKPLPIRIWNAVRNGFRIHGIRFPFVFVQQRSAWAFRSFVSRRTFALAGKEYRYWIHPLTLDNERTVEIPLAREFLRAKKGDVLEVGNVLSNYCPFPHEIVDKYERAPGVTNADIVTFSSARRYDAIVTLSTLEHVGWDEEPREPQKIVRAIEHLKQLLSEQGELLATLPLGYNSFFDNLVREGNTGFSEIHYLLRCSASNQWREAALDEVSSARYGTPYANANALVVGYYRKPAG